MKKENSLFKMSKDVLFCIIIILSGLLCYYNSVYCGFVFDDISAIKDNKDLRPNTPLKRLFVNDFWGTPMQKEQSHKSYRPFCVLTFRWNYWIHGLQPAGYHLVNVILHALVCVLYYRLCREFVSKSTSFVAGLLFSVHPIHTEAVTGIVGRAEILSSVFFLCAFQCYMKAAAYMKAKKTNWTLMLLFMVCVSSAMLCKEQGVTVIGVCAIYELFIIQQLHTIDFYKMLTSDYGIIPKSFKFLPNRIEAIKRLLFLISTMIILILGRLSIMQSTLPVFTRFDNPASVAPTPIRQLTYNYLVSINIMLVLFPCDLCCDWTMGTIPLIKGFSDIRNVATLLTYLTILVITCVALRTTNQQHFRVITMGLVLTVLPFIPASNLFFPVGFVVAERVLYMPSMGFCLLIAYGYTLLSKNSSKHITNIFLISLLLSHAAQTHMRNWDWHTEYSIFMAGLRVNQRNAKLFNNVGHALEGESRFDEALKYFQAAVKVQYDDIGAHINVGRTYNNMKQYDKAEQSYMVAKSFLPKVKPGEPYKARIAPNYLNVFINLANLISKNQSRLEEADFLYRQAISMRSDYTQAYINRGDILMKLNRTKDAEEVYERALFYDNTNADIYYNLGVVSLEQEKTSQALSYFNKALELDPEHEQSLLNSAILLQSLGGEEYQRIAKVNLMKLLDKDDNNERVHFNLGMLAMDESDTDQAVYWFKRAIEVKQDFRSALFNLALVLVDNQRPFEAVPFLKQLISFYPNHVKGLILLGDIYINHLKDLTAAKECYNKILEIEPSNIQAQHNLCVVYIEQGELGRAIICLEEAHAAAPEEDYIFRHLQIVKSRYQKLKQSSPEINVPSNNQYRTNSDNMKTASLESHS